MKKDLIERIKRIKLLILDVDGVLTSGKIIVDHKGKEIKEFNVQDGFGIVFFKGAGFKTAIISARAAGAVKARARDLKIDRLYQDAHPKTNAYRRLLRDLRLKDENACFMGDDLPDVCVLKKVGFAVAVKNACPEVKKNVHYVTKKSGGHGAVREVIEIILKSQRKWEKVLKQFS